MLAKRKGKIPARRRGKRSTRQKGKRSVKQNNQKVTKQKGNGSNKRKDKKAQHKKIGNEVLGFLTTLFGDADMNFATGHNALFGMDHFIAILARMCEVGCAAESAADDLISEIEEAMAKTKAKAKKRMPSGKWFRDMMNSMSEHAALLLCDSMIAYTVMLALKAGMPTKGILVAIDKHLIPRYDQITINQLVDFVSSQAKKGTTKFEAYGTLQVVGEAISPILGCAAVLRGMSNYTLVSGLLDNLTKYGIQARLVLMDREFYSVAIICLMLELNLTFLMPATKHSGTKNAVLAHHWGSLPAVSTYTMRNSKGLLAKFTLVIVRSKKYGDKNVPIWEWYHAFATNLSAAQALREIDELPKEYRIRWGIETAYRQLEEIRPRTTSRSPIYRMVLFYTSMFMRNIWGIKRSETTAKHCYLRLRAVVCAVLYAAKAAAFQFDPGGRRARRSAKQCCCKCGRPLA